MHGQVGGAAHVSVLACRTSHQAINSCLPCLYRSQPDKNKPCVPLQQLIGGPNAAKGAALARHGSTVGDQLQALASRTGKSFAGGLRFRPRNLGINFSELKKQVCLPAAAAQTKLVCNLMQHD